MFWPKKEIFRDKVADSHNQSTLKGVVTAWHSKSKKEIFFGETLEFIQRDYNIEIKNSASSDLLTYITVFYLQNFRIFGEDLVELYRVEYFALLNLPSELRQGFHDSSKGQKH